jgi:Protein of unknown function (DUF664)
VPAEPDRDGSERELLEQYLDVQREALLAKTEGLDQEQMARTHPPSTLTLGGLLYHLSLAEEDWMEIHFSGQRDRDPFVDAHWARRPRLAVSCSCRPATGAAATALPRGLQLQPGRGPGGYEPRQSSRKPVRGEHIALRWVLLHLIEETARHAGHADLLRQAIDGSVG